MIGKRVLLINMGNIWNVPPLFSVAGILTRAGASCTLIGYRTEGLNANETLADGTGILRFTLKSRRLKIAAMRKPLALIEFLILTLRYVRREKPDAVILFNDPVCLLLPFFKKVPKRIVWLLEYPEFERYPYFFALVHRWSAACWKSGTLIVAPTSHRLAIHCTHNPAIQELPLAVVENAPSLRFETAAPTSDNARQALEFVASRHARGLKVAVYSGGISSRHGVVPLIEAIDRDERWALLLVGPCGDAEIGKLIGECRRKDSVRWVDSVPYAQLHDILKKCDLGYAYYVKDTLNQRFCAPGKLYDYLKNGLPVMTDTDSNLYAEVARAGAGVFFESWTKEAIGECLRSPIFSDDASVDAAKYEAAKLFERRLALEYRMGPVLDHLGYAACSSAPSL